MPELKFVPISESKYTREYKEVKEGIGSNVNTYADSGLMSEDIFGAQPDYNSVLQSLDTDNYRGVIHLARPVVSSFIARKGGVLLQKILGINLNTFREIIDLKQVYSKSHGCLIPVKNAQGIDDILVYAEYIEKLVNDFDFETAIMEEFNNIVISMMFTDKAKGSIVGRVNRDGSGIKLIGGYYIDITDTTYLRDGAILEDITEILRQDYLSTGDTRIVYLLNTTKERMLGAIQRHLIVMPMGLRPFEDGRHDQFTEQYNSIILANKNLKEITKMSTVNIFISYYKKLKELIEDLQINDNHSTPTYFSIKEKMSGKPGLIRRFMLSKRGDYTGRAVVIIDPKLMPNEVGIPERIAVKILKHFHCLKLTVNEIVEMRKWSEKRIIKDIKDKNIIEHLIVLLNRAPTLHRPSTKGYRFIIIKEEAIKVNPMVCEGFNMDFDGDTAQAKVPLSPEAQREAEKLFGALHQLFKPADGKCLLNPRHEMAYGLYTCTHSSYKQGDVTFKCKSFTALKDCVYDQRVKVYDTVDVNGKIGIAGHMLFQSILPEGIVFDGKTVTDKVAKKYVNKLIDYGQETFNTCLFNMCDLGFRIAWLYSPNITLLVDLDEGINKPYLEFKEKMKEIDRRYELGQEDEDVYSDTFDEEYSQVTKHVEEDIESVLNKSSTKNMSARVLCGLYNTNKSIHAVDYQISDLDLVHVPSKEELYRLLTNSFIRPKDTIHYKNQARLAGRSMIEELIGSSTVVTPSILDNNKNNKELIDFGLKMSKLYPLSDMPEEYQNYSTELNAEYKDLSGRRHGFVQLVESGARGSDSNLAQIFEKKGRIAKSETESFNAIIESSLSDQLTSVEHFMTAFGSRKGIMDKTLKPGDTGYLERQLWHTTEDIFITREDCGTKEGRKLSKKYISEFVNSYEKDSDEVKDKINSIFIDHLTGRYLADCELNSGLDTDTMITPEMAKEICKNRDVVEIRSPLKCKDPCCSKCFGEDLAIHGKAVRGLPIGFLTAQSIGELLTQMTMKTFQNGGVAGKSRVGSDFENVSQLIYVTNITGNPDRFPGYDPIAWASGKIKVVPDKKNVNNVIASIDGNTRTIKLPREAKLKENAVIGEGMAAVRGDYDLRELSKYAGISQCQDYLVNKCWSIYANTTDINVKYFEVLARCMTLNLVIDNCGLDGYKVGQMYTDSEIRVKRRTRVQPEIVKVLTNVKNLPILRESALSNINMENFVKGLSRSMMLGNTDRFISPFACMMFGLKPKLGTGYDDNYISNIVKEERCKEC